MTKTVKIYLFLLPLFSGGGVTVLCFFRHRNFWEIPEHSHLILFIFITTRTCLCKSTFVQPGHVLSSLLIFCGLTVRRNEGLFLCSVISSEQMWLGKVKIDNREHKANFNLHLKICNTHLQNTFCVVQKIK